MIGNLASDVKSVFKGNIKTLAQRDVFLTAIAGLTGGLDSLFIKEVLHADAFTLGLLASIWSVVFIFFVLIGGWVSEQYSRKKTLLMGMTLSLPSPVIFALASDWNITIVAQIFAAVGTAFATPAYVSLLFSSSERRSRSRSIAIMATLNNIASAIVPPLGALIIERMGGYSAIRYIFMAQFILSTFIIYHTWKRLEDPPRFMTGSAKSLTSSLGEIAGEVMKVHKLAKERGASSWLFLALSGPWAWEVVGPFWILYAAEACGSSIPILGLLPAVYSLTAILLLFPLAQVSDKKGRKKIILFARPFLYLCLLSLILGGTFTQYSWIVYIPVVAWIFRAMGDSSTPSWMAAASEVIPEGLQSQWQATRDFLWRVMTIPATITGGLMWIVDARLPFIFALLVDLLIRFPMVIYMIPETINQEDVAEQRQL